MIATFKNALQITVLLPLFAITFTLVFVIDAIGHPFGLHILNHQSLGLKDWLLLIFYGLLFCILVPFALLYAGGKYLAAAV